MRDRAGGESRTRRAMEQNQYRPEIVRWMGAIQEDPSDHTTEEKHDLKLVKLDGSGDSIDIVDSPEIVKIHHESNRNFLVDVEGEKTRRFLFWGGNLRVKNFRVLGEIGAPLVHRVPVKTASRHRSPERR